MSQPDTVATIPLTFTQKVRLGVDSVPPVFFLAMLVLYVTVLKDVYGGLNPALVLFIVAVVLFTGYESLKRVRDLTSGVALIREDILQRIGRTRRTRGRRYAMFAQLGRLWIRGGGVARATTGRRHRVIYSPSSRIVWSLEPLD